MLQKILSMPNEIVWRLIVTGWKWRGFGLVAEEYKGHELQKRLAAEGYKSFPEEVTEKQDFMRGVDDYIRKKAREDLPEAQFICDYPYLQFRELVEIGGTVMYRQNELRETEYKISKVTNLKDIFKILRDKSFSVGLSGSKVYICRKPIPTAIIHWHTHPGVVDGGMTIEDAVDFIRCDQLTNQQIKTYSVIYSAFRDATFWYYIPKNNYMKRN